MPDLSQHGSPLSVLAPQSSSDTMYCYWSMTLSYMTFSAQESWSLLIAAPSDYQVTNLPKDSGPLYYSHRRDLHLLTTSSWMPELGRLC